MFKEHSVKKSHDDHARVIITPSIVLEKLPFHFFLSTRNSSGLRSVFQKLSFTCGITVDGSPYRINSVSHLLGEVWAGPKREQSAIIV